MTVTQYMSSLPMDTRYYLLDHSSEPDKVKEVLKEKANDSAFLAELTRHIQAMQNKRVANAKQQVAQQQQVLNTEFKPSAGLIKLLVMPFEKRCKTCGAHIAAGEYCGRCSNKQEKGKDFYDDFVEE